jgi:predicted nucleic acid-binding protein
VRESAVKIEGGWVVDASVATKWHLLDEEFANEARAYFVAYSAAEAQIVAPHLIRYEVASAIESARRSGRIDRQSANQETEAFLRLPLHSARDEDWLLSRAAELAEAAGGSLYDAVYLATAEALGFQFITADRRLYERVKHSLPFARWLGALEGE